MKIFREIICIINRTIGLFCFGFATNRIFIGDYKVASWLLFAISILFMISYFTERLSNLKETF